MLPDGFKWIRAMPSERVPTALALGDVPVCRMIDRVDGTWFVYLDYHLPPPEGQLVHRKRDCSTFLTGVQGCELWVQKHEARLRAEVEANRLEWRQRRGLL